MAGVTGKKKKAKVFFVVGDGTFSQLVMAPGDKKVSSTWNPGKSRKPYKPKRK